MKQPRALGAKFNLKNTNLEKRIVFYGLQVSLPLISFGFFPLFLNKTNRLIEIKHFNSNKICMY